MLEYDRIDISEGIDINKLNASKECYICHYWYEPYVCNGCHGLMEKAMNVNDAAIVSVKGSDYKIHFWYMNKDDARNIMKTSNLNEKKWIIINFLLYIKMSDKTTYYRKNRGIILNRATKYYEKNKERLREQPRNKYRELAEEKKIQRENMEEKDIKIYLKKINKD